MKIPAEVKEYKCPVCARIARETLKETLKHANIPQKTLPVGLVYFNSATISDYSVIVKTLNFDEQHYAKHGGIHLKKGGFEPASTFTAYARTVQEHLKTGSVRLLSEEEFNHIRQNTELLETLKKQFKQFEGFVRATPKLEEIAGKAGKK